MPKPTRMPWTRPEVRALSSEGSRADVVDVPRQNIIGPSDQVAGT